MANRTLHQEKVPRGDPDVIQEVEVSGNLHTALQLECFTASDNPSLNPLVAWRISHLRVSHKFSESYNCADNTELI